MTLPDRNLPEFPAFIQDLKLRYGGTEVAAMPSMSSTSFTPSQALDSLMGQLGPALSQIKAIGDIITVLLALIKFAEAVPDAIKEGDPDILLDAAKVLGQVGDKIAPHVPFLQHAVTVYDSLKVIKVALGVVSGTLTQISNAFNDATTVLNAANSTGNDSLKTLAAELETRANAQLDAAGVSVALILKPMEILQEIIQNIPNPPGLPEIPDFAAITGIDELIEIVDNIHDALEAIVG